MSVTAISGRQLALWWTVKEKALQEERRTCSTDFSALSLQGRTSQAIPAATQLETETLERVCVTAKEVRAKIIKLKPFSAAGPDGIGPQLLQELQNEHIPALVTIYMQ
jgi:hypothetical protein